jgi:hypothetical protein
MHPLAFARERVDRSGLQRDVVLQLRPRAETELACDAGLRVVQAQLPRGDGCVIESGGGGQGKADAFERIGCAVADILEQPLGLLLQMVQVRTGGQVLHDNLHAMNAEGPQSRLHKG